jgi:hypothetical protein
MPTIRGFGMEPGSVVRQRVRFYAAFDRHLPKVEFIAKITSLRQSLNR